jgi:hypothetical protein
MRQRLRDQLGAYQVTKEPIMTPPGLRWAPYVTLAVAPYRVTALPRCRVGGLRAALDAAERERGSVQEERDGVDPTSGTDLIPICEWWSRRRHELAIA